MVFAALDGVISIQFNDHVAIASDFHSSLISAAGVNIHAAQGDVGSGPCICMDGDGVGGGVSAVMLGDHRRRIRHILLLALAYGLPALAGIHSDVAVLQIPGLRQYGNRQAYDQKQRHHTGKNSSRFHGVFVSFLARKRALLPGRRGTRIRYTYPRYHCSRKTGFWEYPPAGKNG